MKSNYRPLGNYIQEVNNRDTGKTIDLLLGVSIQKKFIPSIANIIGTDMSTYKIVKRNQFAYGPVTSRNGDKISIALLENYDDAIISQAYTAFEVSDTNQLLPEYLMMWFRRPEFDRYARFMSHGSAREIFGWAEMCNTELPVPHIDKQKEIIKEYNVLVDRIELNNKLIQKLEETAQAIYKQWFVDFEFPDENGLPYKSCGGEMTYLEELERKIPKGWRDGYLNKITEYSRKKVSINQITENIYISTENMLPNRGGITAIINFPDEGNVTSFNIGDILVSNIRPYFKKIWLASFEGGCSNDILCFQPKGIISSEYLYYLLETDAFFDYVMAGSNGDKMPRGDKKWILNYPIVIPDEFVIEKFNQVISPTTKLKSCLRLENELINQLTNVILSKLASLEN